MIDFYRFTCENMIKKNLFLLVSFYFFVLQAIFIGLLRWEVNFYILAIINFVFIVVIAFFSKEKVWNIKTENSLDSVYSEKKVEKVEKIKKIQKNKVYKPIPHIWLFVISILFGFFVWFWLWDIMLSLQLLTSVLSSFILFILFWILFKFKILKVRETKIYLFILIFLTTWFVTIFYNINFDFLDFDYFDKTNNTNDVVDNDILSEIAFVSVDWNTTWSVEDLVFVDETKNILESIDLDKKATFADVIKSLIDENDLILNTSKNIKFNYISYTHKDYAYYRTAYDKKLIWKTINPNKSLLCETYIVMKWLLESRNVWPYSNIKDAYWNYAKNKQKLSTCMYGNYVKLWDLN